MEHSQTTPARLTLAYTDRCQSMTDSFLHLIGNVFMVDCVTLERKPIARAENMNFSGRTSVVCLTDKRVVVLDGNMLYVYAIQ